MATDYSTWRDERPPTRHTNIAIHSGAVTYSSLDVGITRMISLMPWSVRI